MSFARAIAAALAAEASAYNAIGTRARRLAGQFFTPSRTAASALDLTPACSKAAARGVYS